MQNIFHPFYFIFQKTNLGIELQAVLCHHFSSRVANPSDWRIQTLVSCVSSVSGNEYTMNDKNYLVKHYFLDYRNIDNIDLLICEMISILLQCVKKMFGV